eukprot:CAMPEP_0119271050 /NCGR_PEP_ID=MMETSP1329-20130426/7800_1 /TAXON_ID=114041 /ORGANISM="Genus nov. species nov., Strain RCC1024" /LENGTH=479 /DNA_ID=CAMNT_0007271091 /DNA_START=179 /DNA_END=1618 /DNA_ORIENTATION=-
MAVGPRGCFTPAAYQAQSLAAASLVIYPIALLWSFVGTQYIADEFFSVALDGIVEKFHIDPDVAGATILAVGTSFPELICGFVSQFLSAGDSGAVALGVTVGSAIFNQLVIVAASALVAPGGEMQLKWKAMLRDIVVWGATIVLLMATLADGEISIADAWIYVGLYLVYVVLCTYWKTIEKHIHGGNPFKPPRVVRSVVPKNPRHESVAVYVAPHKLHLADFADVEAEVKVHADRVKLTQELELVEAQNPLSDKYVRPAPAEEGQHHHDEDSGPFGGEFPEGFGARLYFVARAPFAALCYYTGLPSLRRNHQVLLLAPIAGGYCVCIAYLMVQWLEKSACALGIPTISLSLLLAASGTSLPNCLVAMYVAKKGKGTTAVSTVFGSNLFDILIALALPWALAASISGKAIVVFENQSFGSAYALTTIMIGTFALFVGLSAANGWVVSSAHAYIYLAIYAAFVVYVILDAIPGIVPGPASA